MESYSPSHAFLNPEQSNYIFRGNHLEDNQFHCKHPGIQQLNMALVGMTSLKLYLCCCVIPSVYYNLVAKTIWLSAYCVHPLWWVVAFLVCDCTVGESQPPKWSPPTCKRSVGKDISSQQQSGQMAKLIIWPWLASVSLLKQDFSFFQLKSNFTSICIFFSLCEKDPELV